ncbi:MAG: hypothetical protein PGN19_08595 [Pseudomonas oryzihabitans]
MLSKDATEALASGTAFLFFMFFPEFIVFVFSSAAWLRRVVLLKQLYGVTIGGHQTTNWSLNQFSGRRRVAFDHSTA